VTRDEVAALFPVVRRFAYFNAGTFGPLPARSAELLAEQAKLDGENGRGGRAYYDAMLETRARVRGLVGELIGAEPETVSLTSSTTDGCNIALAGLDLSPDDEIVTTDQEHFGLAGPVFASGARVRVARVGALTGDELVETIAAGVSERTRLIAVSHVLWTNGHVVDVHALRRRTGVPILVDGAQSVGAIPVDVRGLDFYTVSGQKWLCGPESTGALYVADVEALRVARPGYFAQESFEPGGKFVVRAGATRFDPGWIAVGALRAWEYALQVAPPDRFERLAEVAARCRAALEDAGVEVITAQQQSGLVTFRPREDAAEFAARAYDARVLLRDLPGTGLARASCGWWNDESDVERLIVLLR
jgi:L-cysteine/cystine lyase